MTVEQFKESVTVIKKDNAKLLREIYIDTFVDTDKEYYKDLIQTKKKVCIDGDCYSGYLWDCFINPKRISNFALTDMLLKKTSVYVMWDIHSCERINTEGYKKLFGVNRYWLYDKDNILLIKPSILIEGLKLLPEDIYIFDDTFEWSLCYTHELDSKNRDLLIFAEPKKVTY